jgi:predicted DsbA family dithiol-disulfide isomerase
MLLVDIFSDIACPWCWVGEHRLRAALAQRPELDAVLRWRPFQLRPAHPTPSRPWSDFVDETFGGLSAAQPAFAHLTRLGEAVGIRFHFDRMTVAPNTAEAHRLILLAAEHGRAWPAVEALFRAHFADGQDVGDPATLRAIGIEVGIPASDVDLHLDGTDFRDQVQESQALAAELGITGVPYFIFNGQVGVSGAQSPELLLRAIDQALTEPTPPA